MMNSVIHLDKKGYSLKSFEQCHVMETDELFLNNEGPLADL